MPNTYSDDFIKKILQETRIVALVGASEKPSRDSYHVMSFLQEKGYRVIPVNPGLAGKQIHGETVYGTLADIPQQETGAIDMVDVFRNAAALPGIVDEVLRLDPLPKVLWMQLGVRNDEAAARAEAAGINVVMNRCPKIEYGKLSGEIGWTGVNSGVLSSKKPLMRSGFQSFGVRQK